MKSSNSVMLDVDPSLLENRLRFSVGILLPFVQKTSITTLHAEQWG